jgi:uncharacterized protein YqeY
MSLVAKIDADLKAAMIARDAEKLSVLRMLKSAVKYAAIEKGGADSVPSDLDVLAVVRKEVKKREDSISQFTSAGRDDLASKEKTELDFLKTMLPAQLTPEKMEALVKEAIAEVGATSKAQMGSVMKAAQAKAAGQPMGRRSARSCSGCCRRLSGPVTQASRCSRPSGTPDNRPAIHCREPITKISAPQRDA